MNPYLRWIGGLSVAMLALGMLVTLQQDGYDNTVWSNPVFLLGLVLGVAWLVIKAVRHPDQSSREKVSHRAARRAAHLWDSMFEESGPAEKDVRPEDQQSSRE